MELPNGRPSSDSVPIYRMEMRSLAPVTSFFFAEQLVTWEKKPLAPRVDRVTLLQKIFLQVLPHARAHDL